MHHRLILSFFLVGWVAAAATPPPLQNSLAPGSTVFNLPYAPAQKKAPTYEQELASWKELDLPLRQVQLLPSSIQAAVQERVQQERQIQGITNQAQKVFYAYLTQHLPEIVQRNAALHSSIMALMSPGDMETRKIYWNRVLKLWRVEPVGLSPLSDELAAMVKHPTPLPKVPSIAENVMPTENYNGAAKHWTMEKTQWNTAAPDRKSVV